MDIAVSLGVSTRSARLNRIDPITSEPTALKTITTQPIPSIAAYRPATPGSASPSGSSMTAPAIVPSAATCTGGWRISIGLLSTV